jgi:hypothetical protein
LSTECLLLYYSHFFFIIFIILNWNSKTINFSSLLLTSLHWMYFIAHHSSHKMKNWVAIIGFCLIAHNTINPLKIVCRELNLQSRTDIDVIGFEVSRVFLVKFQGHFTRSPEVTKTSTKPFQKNDMIIYCLSNFY